MGQQPDGQDAGPLPSPSFGPTPKTDRLASIDFVRGLALLGILLVNAAMFFGPVSVLMGPSAIAGMPAPDRLAHLLIVSLCQGKFISIFSMLFGYGLLGQIEKVHAADRSSVGFVLRRLGTLAVFGLLHAVALWYGDILFIYAVLGGWLLLARGARARPLLLVAVVLLSISVILRAGVELFNAMVPLGLGPALPAAAPADGPRGLEAMWRALFIPASPVWVSAEIAAYRDGPWTDALAFRLVTWVFIVVTGVLASGWQVLGMFFVGAAMWRVRFFAPEQSALRRRALVCLPLGVLLEAAAAWFFWAGLTDRRAWALGSAIQGISVCVLPVGYLTSLALLADRLPAWARGPVSSAGRMALTVYLSESLLATALAYHWGLGWFGRVGARTQSALAVAIWAGLVLFSWAWLSRFEQGPLERLWRRLEYGRAARPEHSGGDSQGPSPVAGPAPRSAS
jgi:uncharacterized protein